MKYYRMLSALLCALLLSSAAMLSLAAKSGAEAFTYTYTDDAPIVDTQSVFLSVFDTEKDFDIRGERASWYFFYDNIHHSTNTWAPFSTSVAVRKSENTHLTEALSDTAAYHIDLRDGDTYPGPAELMIPVSDITGDGAFHLFRYEEDPSGKPVLTPLVKSLSLDENGAFTITVTAAYDFLLVPATAAEDALQPFYLSTPLQSETSALSSASLTQTVIFIAIALALILFVIYIITVKVLKKKRQKRAEAVRHG